MDVTSTVLDGVLCLLLVSAAVVTVTTATPRAPAGEGNAPATASTLATTTASVNYSLTPRTETTSVDVPDEASASERTAHGTLAGLLARVAVSRTTVGDERLWHVEEGFERAVVRAVRGAIRTNHTQITATWRPHRGSSVRGRVVIGDPPPRGRTVHAATLEAPSGLPSTRAAAVNAARARGANGTAAVVARSVVDGWFLPTRTRIAAGESSAAASLVRHRYRRAEQVLGVTHSSTLVDGGVDTANDRLATALAGRVEQDLRSRNASTVETAETVRVGHVRIVVRTWP